MEGVATSLENGQRLGVVRMDASLADVDERLKSLNPELVIFELDSPRSPTILSLLRERPGTLLLGLDLDCSQVIVLNSSLHLTRNMKELGQLVQTEIRSKG